MTQNAKEIQDAVSEYARLTKMTHKQLAAEAGVPVRHSAMAKDALVIEMMARKYSLEVMEAAMDAFYAGK